MNVAEIAALGTRSVGPAATTPERVGREFDAMLLRMLWRSASVSAPDRHASQSQRIGDAFGELCAAGLAAQHRAGFGAMALQALDLEGEPR